MAVITPTLNFGGQCEEAIALYSSAFGTEPAFIMRYSERNREDYPKELTPEQESFVYHAEMFIGGQRIMMCDNIDVPFVTSYACFLTVTFDTDEEVKSAFDALSEGGSIIYPLAKTTYSSCRGVLVDRYGFRWGLMTEN